jgi:L-ascorbate metabolism protein UlaG (beta-lactamase superfamily)
MKITKYVHSCLLVETPKQTILIDPGSFSWDSHLLSPIRLAKLDYIVITHDHPDHYNLPFLKELSAKFPHAQIITNEDLAKIIGGEKLPNVILTGSQPDIEVFEVAHEPVPFDLPVPRNIGVHIEGLLTHPGDAFYIKSSQDILALAMTSPWGNLKQALEVAAALKPKKIIPVHDWFWHKVARDAMYAMSKNLLEPHGIEFIEIENAVPVEL